MRTSILASAVAICLAAPLVAQTPLRNRAMPAYRLGLESMRAESWEEAAKHFQAAIDIDAEFDMAFYMLGRANMPQRKYREALAAFIRARDLHLAAAGRQFSNAQDAQRYWRDQILAIDEVLRQLRSGPQTMQVQDQTRQVNERRRQIEEIIQRGDNMSVVNATVPAFISLSLGSAYFRMGNLAEAEKAYRATIEADRKSGEAHNNLAVVYLETGRFDEAAKAVTSAEKAGFRVHPQLKADIKERRKGT